MSCMIGPPAIGCLLLSLRVRSPLIAVQFLPPSVDLNSTFEPMKTSFAFVRETAMGEVQLKRYFKSDVFVSSTVGIDGRMEALMWVFRSSREIEPSCESL